MKKSLVAVLALAIALTVASPAFAGTHKHHKKHHHHHHHITQVQENAPAR